MFSIFFFWGAPSRSAPVVTPDKALASALNEVYGIITGDDIDNDTQSLDAASGTDQHVRTYVRT